MSIPKETIEDRIKTPPEKREDLLMMAPFYFRLFGDEGKFAGLRIEINTLGEFWDFYFSFSVWRLHLVMGWLIVSWQHSYRSSGEWEG